MANKPFKLTFEYTPRWKGNDKRVPDEQFNVTLKDFSERKRIEFRERLVAKFPENEKASALIEYQKDEQEFREQLVIDNVVSVSGLSIETDDGVVNVKTAQDILKYCPEVATEISNRLLTGPTQEELKN